MRDRLSIQDDRGSFRIGWWLAEDADFGLMLGQSPNDLTAPEPQDREEWETWAAERAAASLNPEKDSGGYYWDTKTQAQAALRVIKAALAAERELPEWAKTALLS